MPHINRIRVNNVKYNFGTQSYDDFMMKPFGKNTLYDLANGGGKSVLMLLMLQNVIPNCTLDEKQPIEKLFRTGDGSSTIHSLIEWKLDDSEDPGAYRYMTTGFCARKANAGVALEAKVEDTASIEYFNYCIFYREYNENDIRNLPLVKDKERITYTGLKKYLKDLERDNSLEVRIFERKGEYQNFISRYGLYESEWEIIRGINKTEGHVRTYFETNYKTTRKVVEDLLIEEIIQKSFALKTGHDETDEIMSKTLLDMKDRLLELSKQKEQLKSYDHQVELLENFSGRLEILKQAYEKRSVAMEGLNETYQSAKETIKEFEKDREEKESRKKGLNEELDTITKRVDAIRYAAERKKAEEAKKEADAFLKEINELSARRDELDQWLKLRESMNEFLEYEEVKKKKEEVAEAVFSVKNKNSSLIHEIQELVWILKGRYEKKREELEAKQKEERVSYESIKDAWEKKGERERFLEKETYVWESKLSSMSDSITGLEAKAAILKQDAGLFFLEDLNKASKENRLMIEQEEKVITEITMTKEEKKQALEEIKNQSAKAEAAVDTLQAKEAEENQFFTAYEKEKKKADRLKTVYGSADTKGLLKEIHARYRANLKAMDGLRTMHEEYEKQRENLNRGYFLPDESATIRLLSYLNERELARPITGIAYLKERAKEDAGELLLDYPFLPYSLIVSDEEYSQLKSDAALRDKEFFGVVPVIKESALIKKEELIKTSNMQLAAKDLGIYLDERKLKKELEKLADRMEKADGELKRLADLEQTYMEDEAFASAFLIKYEEAYPSMKDKRAKREKMLKQAVGELQNIKEQAAKLLEEIREKEETLKKAKERRNQRKKEREALIQLTTLSEELNDLYEEQKKGSKLKDTLLEELHTAKEERIKLSGQLEEKKGLLEQITKEVGRMNLSWEEKYAKYEMEGNYNESLLSTEELENKANGKILAFESENTGIEDKNHLIRSYADTMNRLLKSIRNKGISLALLQEIHERQESYQVEDEVLLEKRNEILQLEEVIARQKTLADMQMGQVNRMEGKLMQSLAAMKEKYVTISEEFLSESAGMEEASFIAMKGKKEEELRMCLKEIEAAEKEIRALEEIRKDIERMFKNSATLNQSAALNVVAERKMADELRKEQELFEKEYDRASAELKKKQDDFYKQKQKLLEALQEENAAGLAEEISISVRMPQDEEEAKELQRNLREVSDLLELEKGRIERGIADMANIKSNFENQCLQRCLNIRSELEQLAKLSKITLDGEQIPIIHLQIPYVKEELYKDRMAAYIDQIVAAVDDYEEGPDKLKFIRTSLSLKKLFSVIVTDMNQIRLSLYKRERMKENSRHLRYEEAVGSTGQSQGIYIQFLIAIINYISCLNSGKGENKGLRKVIFIDNPFGAAKDVYIWEPIFELLKTNQVQLIVPARGTTPAITGRFDVNYVLGQKLVDGKQQTVVVDYQSRVNVSDVEYVPLEFEQTSLNLFE